MSKNDHVYAVTRMEGRIYSFLLHCQRAVEIHCDESERASLLGNIYIGKIKNIAKNIEAAFVEIMPGITCYLPLDDLKAPVYTKKGASDKPQAGDELLVQVSREGIKTKFPAVTTNLVLNGKYALLTTGNKRLSVSSKLTSEEKMRLNDYFQRKWAVSEKYGWLLRTNAGFAKEEQLEADMKRLIRQYDMLMNQVYYRTCFSCLYRTPSSYLRRLSDLYETEDVRIVTDDKGLFEEISSYLNEYQPEDLMKLQLYQDSLLPLRKLYSMEHQLKDALQEKVWMKSGGYLVIQPTEALTVIDVNTGKYEGGKKKQSAFLKINLEAAAEIARQIRLRNLSGIILVDFINMDDKEYEQMLMDYLGKELKKDPIKTVLVDMTKLSLVEITRMKKEKTLREAVMEYRKENIVG